MTGRFSAYGRYGQYGRDGRDLRNCPAGSVHSVHAVHKVHSVHERGQLKQERPALRLKRGALKFRVGDDLLFHKVAPAVPWALIGLTAVFGMGTGGALSLKPPTKPEFRRCPPLSGRAGQIQILF